MTDDEILAIAAQLWQQYPGDEFTMERLSEATGLSRATLYRRFGSRESILQRLAHNDDIDIDELSRPDIPTRIVQATRETLNRTGFAGVTVEKIAQEAGVGPATVYRHFGSKEALIEAFIHASSPRQRIRSLSADAKSDLEEDLVLVATTMLEFLQENRGLIRILVFEDAGNAKYLEKIRASQGRTIHMLAEYLAGHMALGSLPPGDPFTLALSFVGILLGLGLVGPHSYDHPIHDYTQTAQSATRTFLHGITQPNPQKLETL